ncbi:MAG: hypothetical protein ACXVEY_11670 [Actinomycetota bacterium]
MEPEEEHERSTRHLARLGLAMVVVVALISGVTVALLRHPSHPKVPHPNVLSSHFVDAHVQLSQGFKEGVYDTARHSLWILTRVEGGNAADHLRVDLTRYDVDTHRQASVRLRPYGDYWYAADIVVDEQGIVWAGWARSLVRFDPTTGHESDYVVPIPPETPSDRRNWGLVPKVTSLLVVRDGIAVSLSSTTRLYLFSRTPQRWSPWLPTIVTANDFTTLRMMPNGEIAVNGTLITHTPRVHYYSRLALIENGVPRLVAPAIWGYEAGDDGLIGFITSEPLRNGAAFTNHVGILDTSTSKPVAQPALSPAITHGPLLTTLAGLFYVPEHRTLGLSIAGMRDDGTLTSSYTFPVQVIECPTHGFVPPTPSPRRCVVDPNFQDLVPGAGRIWILTGSGSSPKELLGYAPVIEFVPSPS